LWQRSSCTRRTPAGCDPGAGARTRTRTQSRCLRACTRDGEARPHAHKQRARGAQQLAQTRRAISDEENVVARVQQLQPVRQRVSRRRSVSHAPTHADAGAKTATHVRACVLPPRLGEELLRKRLLLRCGCCHCRRGARRAPRRRRARRQLLHKRTRVRVCGGRNVVGSLRPQAAERKTCASKPSSVQRRQEAHTLQACAASTAAAA
jgi:hypothetical protein